jgi:hypothetical protein
MSAVEVEIAEEVPGSGEEEAEEGRKEQRRARATSVEVEVEKEITKRELIRSLSSIVVVLLYMVFTLLRDREAGVVVIDADDNPSDDWES